MSNKQNDIFYEAIQEIEEEKAERIKDWQFISWITSKEEILTDPITPIEEYERSGLI